MPGHPLPNFQPAKFSVAAPVDSGLAWSDGVAWIDPSDLSTQTFSGTDVLTITDKENAQVYSAGSGKYPITGNLALNGKDLWQNYNKYTSGVHDSTVNTITRDFTLYWLHKGGLASVGGGNAFFFGGSNEMFSLAVNSDWTEQFYLTTATTGATSVTVTPSGGNTDTRLTVVKYDGTNLTIDVNGTDASAAVTGNIGWGVTPSDFMRLGAGTGTNYIRSFFGELLICDSAHDAGQVTSVKSYFNTKYGL